MSAIAHGWKPPAGSAVARIPETVAKEFHAADAAGKKQNGRKGSKTAIHNLGHFAHPKKRGKKS